LAGNFGPWLFCSVRHGCPVWPFAEWGLSQVLAFWSAGGRGLVAPSGGLSVCATRFFRLWTGPVFRWFVQHAGVPAWRGASRGSPAAPSGLQVNRGGQNGATGVVRAAGFWPASPSANLGVWSLRGVKGIRLHQAVFFGFSCSSWCGGLSRPAEAPSRRGASRVLDLPWIHTGSLCPVFLVGSAASPPALAPAGSGSRPCKDSPTKQ